MLDIDTTSSILANIGTADCRLNAVDCKLLNADCIMLPTTPQYLQTKARDVLR